MGFKNQTIRLRHKFHLQENNVSNVDFYLIPNKKLFLRRHKCRRLVICWWVDSCFDRNSHSVLQYVVHLVGEARLRETVDGSGGIDGMESYCVRFSVLLLFTVLPKVNTSLHMLLWVSCQQLNLKKKTYSNFVKTKHILNSQTKVIHLIPLAYQPFKWFCISTKFLQYLFLKKKGFLMTNT